MEWHKAPGYVALDCAGDPVRGAERHRRSTPSAGCSPRCSWPPTGRPAPPPRPAWVGCTTRCAPGGWTPTGPGSIVDELEVAPPEVRDAVIAALDPWFDVEDGPHLRRRYPRALARISPDLLRQRAEKARANSGLRRWVDQPGVDTWEGTFPSEEAAQAWAAIDALAQQYVQRRRLPHHRAGPCEGPDRPGRRQRHRAVRRHPHRPRHPAVRGHHRGEPTSHRATQPDTATATVDATEPGSDCQRREWSPRTPGDLVEVGGLRPGDQALVARGWLDRPGRWLGRHLAGCDQPLAPLPPDHRRPARHDTAQRHRPRTTAADDDRPTT